MTIVGAHDGQAGEPGVLAGVRVIDFGRFIAAPYCGMILADMGAEVVRVERPGGDEDRRLGLTASNGENLTFPLLARNKLGITLDLRQPSARPVLFDLVRCSDVLLHNFGPGAAAALGLAYDDVRQVKPDLIYTEVSCYGTVGPDAHRTGFDPIAQVASGAAALNGTDGDAPLRCGVPWVDYSTGLCAALGTVLALRHRDKTGKGQAVDCSLLRTAISYVSPMIAEATVLRRPRPRLGNRAAYMGPTDLYQCLDGHVYVVCATDAAWKSLAGVIGRPDFLTDSALQTSYGRFEQRHRVDPVVTQWIAQRTVRDVVAAMDAVKIPCGIYRSTNDVADDPQVQADNILIGLNLEWSGLEHVPAAANPIRLSRTASAIRSRPPRVGEHNRHVYEQLLQYDQSRLGELQRLRVI